jgi:proteasome lid subunit RPN8/RPN11
MENITLPSGIPLVVITSDDDDVDSITAPVCYVIAQDGLYVRKSNRLYTSLTQAKKVEVLPEIKSHVIYRTCRMPRTMFSSIESFLRRVFDEHKSEACVLLYYHFENNTWIWSIPSQEVSGGGVDYDRSKDETFVNSDGVIIDELPDGFNLLGSIHSHASMSAFHSGTDDNDEFNFDGLHVTIGSFSSATCTYSARWIISSEEFKVELDDIIDAFQEVTFPEDGLKLIKEKKFVTKVTGQSWNGGQHGNPTRGGKQMEFTRGSNGEVKSGKQGKSGKKKDDIPKAEELGIVLHETAQ